jgi:hypothetical protein
MNKSEELAGLFGIKVVPDFQEPENFVKLLELCYSHCGGIDEFINAGNIFADDFIDVVIRGLIMPSDTTIYSAEDLIEMTKNLNNFQKKAQSVDWKY